MSQNTATNRSERLLDISTQRVHYVTHAAKSDQSQREREESHHQTTTKETFQFRVQRGAAPMVIHQLSSHGNSSSGGGGAGERGDAN